MPNADPTVIVANAAVNTGSAVTTTASNAPAARSTQFVFFLASSGAAFTDTTAVSGQSLTWTKVQTVINGNDIWGLYVGYGTPTTGTISITFSRTPTAGRYVVINVAESQTGSNPVAASAKTSGTNTSGTITLTQNGVTGYFMSFWGHKAAEGTTPDASTGWAELTDTATTYGLEVQYIHGYDVSMGASWTTSSDYAGIGVQLSALSYSGVKPSDTRLKAGTLHAVEFGTDGGEDTNTSGPAGVWAIVG